MARRMTIGAAAYGLAFCVGVPGALAAWAWALDGQLGVPGWRSPIVGVPTLILGLAIMAAGWLAIITRGDGLPMNAAPPRRWVSAGIFALLPHPIYTGFVVACFGASILAGSWSGLAIVTPVVAAACAALWWGYERQATLDRLGVRPTRPFLSLAMADDGHPGVRDLFSTWFLILLPWTAIYLGIQHLPVPAAIETWLSWERRAEVHVWTEWIYAAAYPLAAFAPLLAPTRRTLRRFQIAALLGTLVGCWLFLAFPLITTPRPFNGDGPAAWMLAQEHADGLGARAAWPSFHVFWALLCAWFIAQRRGAWRWLGWTIGAAITFSTWTTGMHGLSDIASGVALFAICIEHQRVWRLLLAGSEAVANSWHEWRVGRVRLLGYAIWPGLAASTGWLIADSLTGGRDRAGLALIAACGLVGAGAWGQWLEASSKLARPFGYYGHLLGSICGVAIALLLGWCGWDLLAGLAAAGPWVMALGRIRCLTQGCCHGRACATAAGITYTEPRSRVLRFTDLGHRAVHATQLYSILGNLFIGGLLIRAWSAAAPESLIVGGYFLLSGLLRFVEEHYRGEPQTQTIGGLRTYQWLAIVSIPAGMAISALPSLRAEPALWSLDWKMAAAALAAGLIYGACMGVDFPSSNRRFARLA